MKKSHPAHFLLGEVQVPVKFIETVRIKTGVSCDVYRFIGDDSKDLAIVTVNRGITTPRQRVLLGVRTIEGYISGQGKLTIQAQDNVVTTYEFPGPATEVNVEGGQVMQWQAVENAELVFYEICDPPFKEGRFENLPDRNGSVKQ